MYLPPIKRPVPTYLFDRGNHWLVGLYTLSQVRPYSVRHHCGGADADGRHVHMQWPAAGRSL